METKELGSFWAFTSGRFQSLSGVPLLDQIPKGNTCDGVNRAVVEALLALDRDRAGQSILDVPCGHGILLKVLRAFFPKAVIKGADLQTAPEFAKDEVVAIDASRSFTIFPERKFDVIISVSGIMEFHNTQQFFETCRDHLAPEGRLVVTNDNVFTVRDRLANLFFGRTRLFRLLVSPEQVTWNLIPTQGMVRMLHDAGFVVDTMRYVSAKPSDWLLLPLAALIWPFQWAQLQAEKKALPENLRSMMFPFTALIYRHYVVVCRKRT